MAFGRSLEVEVGLRDQSGIIVSGLDMSVAVKRSNVRANNTAELTIINASVETREKLENSARNVTIRAGYEDEDGLGTIFIGNLYYAASYRDGTEWLTQLHARAISTDKRPPERSRLSLSYAPQTPISTVLNDIGVALGLVVFGAENAADLRLPNGFVFVGRASHALDYCADILAQRGAYLFIDNATLVVYFDDQPGTYTAAHLTYDSGLLAVRKVQMPQLDEKQRKKNEKEEFPPKNLYQLDTILIPRVRPNALVTVDSPLLEGTFLVEQVEFRADNFGRDFGCTMEVSSR